MAIFTLAGLSGALLLYTSQTVQNIQRELSITQEQIEKEARNIRTLKAEWAFLSAPDRLQKIVENDLGLSMEEDSIILPSFIMLHQNANTPSVHDASYKDSEQ